MEPLTDAVCQAAKWLKRAPRTWVNKSAGPGNELRLLASLWARFEAITVTQMGRERRCAHREGFVAFVAEGCLLPADATSRLFFVPKLFGLAVAGLPDLGRPRGGVGGLNGVLGLTDCPAAIARITDFVRAGCRCLLAGGSRGGLLGLPDRGFGDDRGFGNILVVICLGRRAGWRARRCVLRPGSLEGRLFPAWSTPGGSPPLGSPAKIRPS